MQYLVDKTKGVLIDYIADQIMPPLSESATHTTQSWTLPPSDSYYLTNIVYQLQWDYDYFPYLTAPYETSEYVQFEDRVTNMPNIDYGLNNNIVIGWNDGQLGIQGTLTIMEMMLSVGMYNTTLHYMKIPRIYFKLSRYFRNEAMGQHNSNCNTD